MPFSHIEYPIPREAYLQQIGDLLEDKETVVFLDTNILAYLFKLLEAARAEFFVWTEKLISEERLKVPSWVLSEYLSKLTSGGIDEYTARSNEPNEIRKKLENLQNIASLFIDETVLTRIGFTYGRAAFLDQFETATKKLSEFTSVFAHQFDAATIHKEIASRLSTTVLASNIGELSMRAYTEGEMRVSQRMPPGFKDSGKSANKYGDLVIWFEILEFAKSHKNNFKKVVFLSNDEKSDWVYTPRDRLEVIKGAPKSVPNKDPAIRVADPRLIAEFHALVGHRDFHIVSLPVFIESLSKVRSSGFENLALAIQVEVAKSVSEGANAGGGGGDRLVGAAEISASVESPAEQADKLTVQEVILSAAIQAESTASATLTVAAGTASSISRDENYPQDALRDGAYEPDEKFELDLVIRDLCSHNWYTQNPAITRLKNLRDSVFSKGAWFVLGRNIYQAACGNAQKALEFIRDFDIQLSRFPDETAVHILSGALFEIYFDGTADFRKTPKSGQIDPVFKAALNDQYLGAREFIAKQLEPYTSQLVVLPGSKTPCSLLIEVTTAMVGEAAAVCEVLSSVKFAGHQLLFNIAPTEEKSISVWGMHEKRWTLKSIKETISDKWVVPSWLIDSKIEPTQAEDTIFFVPDGKVLRTENLLKIH